MVVDKVVVDKVVVDKLYQIPLNIIVLVYLINNVLFINVNLALKNLIYGIFWNLLIEFHLIIKFRISRFDVYTHYNKRVDIPRP